VVVRRQVVTALEAVEGTDDTIRRGGRLAGAGAVVVKVSKPGQDLRFDLPTVGKNTIEVMSEVNAGVLAIEAGKTLIFDRQEMLALADQAGIVVWGVEAADDCSRRL
jgi:UDP-2,3-diacylglucosamine hydrolase